MKMTDAIAVCIQTGLPFVLWDKPGTGKSKVVEAICRSLDLHCLTVIAGIHEPADFAGYGAVIEKELKFLPAPFARIAAQRANEKKETFIFLDEISCAPPAVQSALLRPVLEGYVGDTWLDPQYVRWGAAANPPDCAAEGWDLRPPFANRLVHLKWEATADTWCQGMISGWPDPAVSRLPATWPDNLALTRALVAAWIRAQRTNLHTMNDQNSSSAFASPRTLDMCATVLAATRSLGVADNGELAMTLIAGCIGEGPALEFLNFIKEVDLGDPAELLEKPESFKLPKRSDRAFAQLSSAVALILAKTEGTELQTKVKIKTMPEFMKWKWIQGWHILSVVCDQGGTDIAAVIADILIQQEVVKDLDIAISEIPDTVDKFKKILKAK